MSQVAFFDFAFLFRLWNRILTAGYIPSPSRILYWRVNTVWKLVFKIFFMTLLECNNIYRCDVPNNSTKTSLNEMQFLLAADLTNQTLVNADSHIICKRIVENSIICFCCPFRAHYHRQLFFHNYYVVCKCENQFHLYSRPSVHLIQTVTI